MEETLETAGDVIDAIGGTAETGRITGQALATVSNWRSRKRIPPEHFLRVSQALRALGKTVTPDVFGMSEPVEAAE